MTSIDLFRPFVAPEARTAVAAVVTPDKDGRTYLGQGPLVDRFERELGTVLDAETDVLTLNSCTSALDLALTLCGVGPGDVVMSTPMTCSATNSPIVTRGAKVLWADVSPLTGLIDPEDVGRKLTAINEQYAPYGFHHLPKAVLAVDWGGRMCDFNRLREVCRPYGVPIIEDAAHSLLATYNGRYQTHVGGDYICWSFQAIKHLTTGDGGAMQVPPDQVERARLLRWYGLDRTKGDSFRCSQDITEVGWKYHPNDIAASIGLANLPHLAGIVKKHREHARWYGEHLKHAPGVTLPPWDAGSSWWLYCLLLENEEARDDLIRFLGACGITASPVHRRNDEHTAFKAATHPASGKLPGVDAFASREVAIPVGWWLDEQDLRRVAAAIVQWAIARNGQTVHLNELVYA